MNWGFEWGDKGKDIREIVGSAKSFLSSETTTRRSSNVFMK